MSLCRPTGARWGILIILCLQLGTGEAGAEVEEVAVSFGRGSCGKLAGGAALPCSGENFEAFTNTACALGRNHLHPVVMRTVSEAYALLSESNPDRTWQYGDLGWESGGSFKPHRTHQNGLSADFFVPVRTRDGTVDKLPISPFNHFGYGLDFDRYGQLEELTIDWTAMSEHLLALEQAGRRHGVRIRRVILDPKLQTVFLRKAPATKRLRHTFSKRSAWVRHDEHYHITFEIPDRFRRPLICRAR